MAKEIIAVERGADGKYSAYTTTLDSVIHGSGDTAEEAVADFKNSLSEVLEYQKENGEVLEELQDLTFEYSTYHDAATCSATQTDVACGACRGRDMAVLREKCSATQMTRLPHVCRGRRIGSMGLRRNCEKHHLVSFARKRLIRLGIMRRIRSFIKSKIIHLIV